MVEHCWKKDQVMQSSVDESAIALRAFLQENIEPLQGIIRSYVVRAELAHGDAVQNAAHDVMNEATLLALAHAELFSTVRQPRAWFLGIAANVIKRRRASFSKQKLRELSISPFIDTIEDSDTGDFFIYVSRLACPGPEQEVEIRAQVADMLSLVSPDDQQVLRLAFLQDLDTQHLALALNVPPGTARVRLHRALNRLRAAWNAHVQQEQEGGPHA